MGLPMTTDSRAVVTPAGMTEQTLRTLLAAASESGRLAWDTPAEDSLRTLEITRPLATLLPLAWWGPLHLILHDPAVHDVYVNGPGREVLVGRHGRVEGTGLQLHASWIVWLQQKCVALQAGRDGQATRWYPQLLTDTLAAAPEPRQEPLADWDGQSILGGVTVGHGGVRRLRYALTHPHRTPDGPSITLRILPDVWPTLDQLVGDGMLTAEIAQLLERAMATDSVTVVISGETGSGKTTLAAALKELLTTKRSVVIQDAPELPTGGSRNDLSYVVPDGDSAAFVTCLRAALRQQPDRIIIGEGRGPELLAMIDGAATGHPGLTTLHATGCEDALRRIETYAGKAPSARPESIRADLMNLDMLLVHLGRPHGRRQVVELAELRRGSERVPGGRFELGIAYALHHGTLRPTDDPLRGRWSHATKGTL